MGRIRHAVGVLILGGLVAGAFLAGTRWQPTDTSPPSVTEVVVAPPLQPPPPPATKRTQPPATVRTPTPEVMPVTMEIPQTERPYPPVVPPPVLVPEIKPVVPEIKPVVPEIKPVVPDIVPVVPDIKPLVEPGPVKVYVRSRNVVFDYEISKKGASGVAEVQLWMGKPEDRALTRVATTKPDKPLRTTVEADGEYLAKAVFVSGSGQLSDQSGGHSAADIRFVVDSTPPKVTITVDPPGGAGMTVEAKVSDPNLDPATVRLSWRNADDATGKWTDVTDQRFGAGDGAFRWIYHPDGKDLPPKVLLRVTAADKAGNTAEATTPAPIATDVVRPTGRLTGVRAEEKPIPPPGLPAPALPR